MAESGLDSLRQTHEVSVDWRAFELRPAEAPAPSPEQDEAHRQYVLSAWPRVAQIARERFGLELKRAEGEVQRDTRLAHEGAKFAAEHGQGEAYHRAVFRAHWQELRDISSPEALAEIAGDLGLDEADFRKALAEGRHTQAVLDDERLAAEYGLTGVPAFIFCNHYLVSGAQPAEALRQVADRCIHEGRVE